MGTDQSAKYKGVVVCGTLFEAEGKMGVEVFTFERAGICVILAGTDVIGGLGMSSGVVEGLGIKVRESVVLRSRP